MADSITWCRRREHPRIILDIAGLTGSVYSFLGPHCAAFLTVDDSISDTWEKAAETAGEAFMRLPALQDYRAYIKSPFADLTNAPETAPGITAGMFLREFAGEIPFLHVDLGATPFADRNRPGQRIGATGFGICTLYEWLKELEAK